MTFKPSFQQGARLPPLISAALPYFICFIGFSLVAFWLAFGHGGGQFGASLRRQISHSSGFCLSCRLGDVDPSLSFVRTALDATAISADLEEKAKAFASAQ